MTDTTRRGDSTNALDHEILLHQQETYKAVKFVFKNVTSSTVTVEYRQTVPDRLASAQVSFSATYRGDAWAFQDSTLEFAAEIEGGTTLETVYGIKDTEFPTLVDRITGAEFTVTRDGHTIETITEIDPSIHGRDESTTDADAETNAVDSSDTGAGPISPESAASEPADTAGQQEGGDGTEDGRHDSEPGRSDGPQPGQPADGERESTGDEQTIEWKTVPEGRSGDEAATDTSRGESGREAAGETRQTARDQMLPVNRKRYILEDVRGEITSSSEFEWVELADNADDATHRGILGWVRSHLPL